MSQNGSCGNFVVSFFNFVLIRLFLKFLGRASPEGPAEAHEHLRENLCENLRENLREILHDKRAKTAR